MAGYRPDCWAHGPDSLGGTGCGWALVLTLSVGLGVAGHMVLTLSVGLGVAGQWS